MCITNILLLILGITLVVAGSDFLVDGASAVARKSGISEFVIGLTIVGIGTSTPEMVVSFISAIQGSSDMSVGNILGSNIFNTCLILGLTAVILPMKFTPANIRRDIPLNILITVLLIVLGMNRTLFHIGRDELSRFDGAILLLCFALYMYSCFKNGKEEKDEAEEHQEKTYRYRFTPIILIIAGIAGLLFGGRLFVDNASIIARHMGWSDKFIGITILAMGTSLPELATCVVAAAKKKGQLALGNIIGSNISNILLILGGSSLIRPLSFANITSIDLGFLLLTALFLLVSYFTFGKKTLDRSEGVILLLMEAFYFYLLVISM